MHIAAARPSPCDPPERGSSSSSRLTREQVVDRIISINRSATTEFLNRFPDAWLEEYLQRLSVATGPRGRHSVWVRPADAPAIVTCAPRT